MIIAETWEDIKILALQCQAPLGAIYAALSIKHLVGENRPVTNSKSSRPIDAFLNIICLKDCAKPQIPNDFYRNASSPSRKMEWLPWIMETNISCDTAAYIIETASHESLPEIIKRAIARPDIDQVSERLKLHQESTRYLRESLLEASLDSPWWWRFWMHSEGRGGSGKNSMVMPLKEDLPKLRNPYRAYRLQISTEMLKAILPDPSMDELADMLLFHKGEVLWKTWPHLHEQIGEQKPEQSKPFTGATQTTAIFIHPHANLIAAMLNREPRNFRAQSDNTGFLKIHFKNKAMRDEFNRTYNYPQEAL